MKSISHISEYMNTLLAICTDYRLRSVSLSLCESVVSALSVLRSNAYAWGPSGMNEFDDRARWYIFFKIMWDGRGVAMDGTNASNTSSQFKKGKIFLDNTDNNNKALLYVWIYKQLM